MIEINETSGEGPVGDVIEINETSGEVTLSNPLDFETTPSIVFTVFAIDNGNPPLNSSVTVTLIVLNQLVLDLNGINMDGNNFTTSFLENGNSVSIVGVNVTISDDDTDRPLDLLTSVVVEIINPLDGNLEFLTIFQTPFGITVRGDASHRITLSGERSFDEYVQALLGLQYNNNMSEPVLDSRLIKFTVYQFRQVAESVYTTVDVLGVNNHSPMIKLGGDNIQNFQTDFHEGSMGVPIASPSVRIVDVDSGDDVIVSLRMTPVIPFVSSDRLFVSNTSQLPSTITINDRGSGHLTFNGPASIADFITALLLIRYQNINEEFKVGNPLTKFLSVTVTDATLSSLSSFVTITLIPVNDHQPEFGFDLLEVSVSELLPVGTELLPVGTVITVLTAMDNDTLLEPSTIYTILNESSQLLFQLNETTGELINIELLDSKTFPRPYVLTVQTRDTEYNGPLLPDVLTILISAFHPPYLTLDSTNSSDPGDLTIGSGVSPEVAYFTTFLEDGDSISVTSAFLDITDIDSDSGFDNLSYAIVYIRDGQDTELLNVSLTNNIQLTADSNYTWLNLTGPTTIEEFEDVLRTIRLIYMIK